MAFNSADWTIDYTAKTVTNNDSATGNNLPAALGNNSKVGSVLEFFQWLAATFAASPQMDDDYAIQSDTPTVYKWINGWAFGHANDIKYLSGGDFESSDGLELWANLYTIGTQEAGTINYVIQNGAEITPWWIDGNLDILVKVKNAGALIDYGLVTVMAREYGDENDHFLVDLSNGRNVGSINTANDKNNNTAAGTVALYGVTYTFGSVSKNLLNGAGLKNYDVVIDCNGKTIAEAYEHSKWATQHNSTETINGAGGEQYLAANAAYTQVKKSAFGEFAGGKWFGARGVWFENYSGDPAFELIASDETPQIPPQLKSATVAHAALVGCSVLIAETSGGVIIKNQYTVLAKTVNTIQMTGVIDQGKAPQSGVVRFDNTEYAYTGFSGDTLTGVTPDCSGVTGSCYVPIMSLVADAVAETSGQIIYSAPFTVASIVRKYGFKPFVQAGTFGANGLPVTPILAVEPQAS